MKITVLNGSPKGNLSVTLQYVNFIQKKFPQHELKVHNISQRIKKIEKDDKAFQEIIDDVKSSDGVLWAFPLYVFIVASQYKRFIELISERKAEDAFKNKYTAVLTTSIHFFDHTAHNYMHAVCDDLEMKYIGMFSPDMRDLMKEEEREKLIIFAESLFEGIESKIATSKSYKPLTYRRFDYVPGKEENKMDTYDKKIVVVTDSDDKQTNLGKMIERFRDSFSSDIEVINLHDIDIKGGCLGCVKCGFDYKCAYTGKDGFIEFYNTKLKTADILIFAGAIKDRYLSSKWKQFFDRGFFNTHTPSISGKQIGFIISGPFSQIPNLKEVLQAYIEWQNSNLVDYITDEFGDSAEIDDLLHGLAERLIRFSEKNYIKPATFLGVGGMKIFRDNIWGRLRFVFQADHKYYEENGIYDFPQYDKESIEFNEKMIEATKNPETREIIRNMLKTKMVEQFQEIVSDLP